MSDAARWTRVGTLAAFSLLLSYVETFIPIPLPGVKLGLANVAVLAELSLGDITGAASIACIKVLASGFLFGSPLTMAYSAAGTLLGFAGMAPLSRLRTMRLWMVSVVGALLHEIGQLVVAQTVLQTNAVWYTLPALMAAGCITGALCGSLAESLRASLPAQEEFSSAEMDTDRLEPRAPRPQTLVAFACLVTFAIAVLHLSSIPALIVCVAFTLAACLAARMNAHALLRVMPLVASAYVLTLVLHLVATTADVETAALEAFRASARLAGLALSGRAFAATINANDLTGTVAWLVRPLERLGMRTQGFVLAFDVALRLVPVMGEVVQKERLDVRTLRGRLPHLIHEVCLRAARLG